MHRSRPQNCRLHDRVDGAAVIMIAGILLAAGASRRFGTQDKLLQVAAGRPLVEYAADAMRAVELDEKIAVVRTPAVAALLPDFQLIDVSQSAPQMATSLGAGIMRAVELGAHKALVHLGDMPFVTEQVLVDVVDQCSDQAPSAAQSNAGFSPPACFPAAYFPQLMTLSGDTGARHLLRHLSYVTPVRVAVDTVADIDLPKEFKLLEKRLTQR